MSVFFAIGAIAGVVLGVALTMLIMISLIKKSNDWGDYDDMQNTMKSFEMIRKADNVKSTFLESGKAD